MGPSTLPLTAAGPDLDQRPGRRFLGQRRIPQHAASQLENPLLVAAHEPIQGSLLALLAASQQFVIAIAHGPTCCLRSAFCASHSP